MTSENLYFSHQQHKRERKMKELSKSAQAAKALRTELKKAFPKQKFSVTCENYSMGNAVRVFWENGPTRQEVDKIAGKYQQGHFDGMTDCYKYSNTNKDIPQAMFVSLNRGY